MKAVITECAGGGVRMKRIALGIGAALVLTGTGALLLPFLLTALGLNAPYEGTPHDLRGCSALIVTTSQSTLGEGGKATGVYASELTVPYYEFLDAGMDVDLASIQGGVVPIEPASLRYPLKSPSDRRYLQDGAFRQKVEHALKIDDVDFTRYDLVFLAGGWGAAYDLGQSDILGLKVSEANAGGVVLGSVCHGALGFLRATDMDGRPLMAGRRMTCVTDKQIQELRIGMTPLHPEAEYRRIGADVQYHRAFRDFFATLTVVDGNLVTGQNQNSASETAQRMMDLISSPS